MNFHKIPATYCKTFLFLLLCRQKKNMFFKTVLHLSFLSPSVPQSIYYLFLLLCILFMQPFEHVFVCVYTYKPIYSFLASLLWRKWYILVSFIIFALYHVWYKCIMFAFFVCWEEDRARELAEGKLNWLKRQASWTVNLPSASVFSSV